MTTSTDTIVAPGSAIGGPVAVVRLSGPEATTIAAACWRGAKRLAQVAARRLVLGTLHDDRGQILDHCLAVRMPGPDSYTGEDCVELHCHGGALTVRAALDALLAAGARMAQPGEFTRRAFINDRLDLTQAEAVLDVIEARSTVALRVANRQLAGRLGRRVAAIYDAVARVLAESEVQLDFTDEDLDFTSGADLAGRIDEDLAQIAELLRHRHDGEILRDGLRLVIAGPPNVGKSSLMNLILGRGRAIVTDMPGTTRDTLEEYVQIRGIPIRITDTAGIRKTDDRVEREGVARSLASVDAAALTLWVTDATVPAADQRPPVELEQREAGILVVANKIDLSRLPASAFHPRRLPLCALTGVGLEDIYDAIESHVWRHGHRAEPDVAVAARHADLLDAAVRHLGQARQPLRDGEFELAAVCLRTALDALGRIIGRTTDPDLLDHIFNHFCIGK